MPDRQSYLDKACSPYLVHEANPSLLHSVTALGVGHEGQQMLLEDILAFPVKAAVVLAGLLEVVLLLNPLLHAGTRGGWGSPGSAVRLAGSVVINVVLLGGVVVHLQKSTTLVSEIVVYTFHIHASLCLVYTVLHACCVLHAKRTMTASLF